MSESSLTIPASPPSVKALTEHLAFLLARSNAVSQGAGNTALAEYDLKQWSFSVLAIISSGSRPSQRDLAEFLRLDPSQVVSCLDRLERRGLVIREPNPSDRRANVMVATDEGKALAAAADAAITQVELKTFGALTDGQRVQLAEILSLVAFSK